MKPAERLRAKAAAQLATVRRRDGAAGDAAGGNWERARFDPKAPLDGGACGAGVTGGGAPLVKPAEVQDDDISFDAIRARRDRAVVTDAATVRALARVFGSSFSPKPVSRLLELARSPWLFSPRPWTPDACPLTSHRPGSRLSMTLRFSAVASGGAATAAPLMELGLSAGPLPPLHSMGNI
jgi:hypothetical protein